MMKIVLLSCLLGLTLAAPKNDLTCKICTDVIGDLDEWITSDTTENDIILFLEDSVSYLLILRFKKAIYVLLPVLFDI